MNLPIIKFKEDFYLPIKHTDGKDYDVLVRFNPKRDRSIVCRSRHYHGRNLVHIMDANPVEGELLGYLYDTNYKRFVEPKNAYEEIFNALAEAGKITLRNNG